MGNDVSKILNQPYLEESYQKQKILQQLYTLS